MLPLLPFAAGLAVGAAAVGMLRGERARAGIAKAQQTLRGATASGAAVIQRSTAAVRHVFAGESPAEPAKAARPRRKPAAKPAAAKTAAPGRARKASPKTESKA